MKMSEVEEKFKGCVASSVTFKDGKELIVYSEQPLNQSQLDVLHSLTSKEFKRFLLNSMNFNEHKIED